ncbi:hypothetical protein [Lentzea sp. CC55]|uniref:hypothetical protein n=1 Tax=Lentzea sp. CC55 TaxID=2884909 RepID=UPI001F18D37E|nr:hypothetical protein [Lentzea sp. CC55]MCG8926615.1 hypothetical protein [Lentzea sp. CC55]
MSIPPHRRVPFYVALGDTPAQLVGYVDQRELARDTDAALVSILRDTADEIERQVAEEHSQ